MLDLKTSDVTRIFRLGGLSLEHGEWRRKRYEVGGKYQKWKLGNHGLEVEVYTKEYVLVGDIASAEGAKLRLPKVRSPFRLGGLGERF